MVSLEHLEGLRKILQVIFGFFSGKSKGPRVCGLIFRGHGSNGQWFSCRR